MTFEQQIDAALNIAARSDDLSHLVRVASRCDGVAKIVGFLHDSVEDGYATQEGLGNLFPVEVVDAVMVLSRLDGESYGEYIERVALSDNDLAVDVKLVDLHVNLNRARVDRFSLVGRYERAIERLLDVVEAQV